MRLARTASPLPRTSGRQDSNLLRRTAAPAEPARPLGGVASDAAAAPEAGGVAASPTARRKVGRRDLLPSTGAARCSNAFRSHPLPVGTPASHRRGPPGRCPLPLATPNARYGPRTAWASAVFPSLPWTIRRRPNPTKHPRRDSNPRFRVEGPASSPVRPRGRELRRQGSNLRFASNSRASYPSTTPDQRRQQDSNLRAALMPLALPCLLGHASKEAEGEGVEPPRPAGPPVFETGYRARWQSFQE